METFQRLLEPLAAYPRWFVITCLVLAAIAAGWVLAKLARWALHLVVVMALLVGVLLAVAWLLG
jgi:hypothetical protein